MLKEWNEELSCFKGNVDSKVVSLVKLQSFEVVYVGNCEIIYKISLSVALKKAYGIIFLHFLLYFLHPAFIWPFSLYKKYINWKDTWRGMDPKKAKLFNWKEVKMLNKIVTLKDL